MRPLLTYLRERVGPTTSILSEEGYALRYGLPAAAPNKLFELTWFDNDGDGNHTPQDVVDAVWDGKPDYVLVYGQITPHLAEKLRTSVLPHQYRKVFEQPYQLSTVMTLATRGRIELWRRNGTYKGKYPL
jgi:hypothetical protein